MDKLNFQSINIELTKRCNLNCKYCYAILPNKVKPPEMSSENYNKFFHSFNNAGGRQVLLTGGEIFLRDDLHDIVDSAYKAGLHIQLFSNGTLIKESDMEWIKQYVDLINISLDGPKSNHDKVRGLEGSFEKTLRTIELLHKNNIRFLIQTTVTNKNYNDMGWLKNVIKMQEPLLVNLGHVCSVGRGIQANELQIPKQFQLKLKDLAIKLCEESNDFHTRVSSNLVTKEEFSIFYPSVDNVTVPWMYPDGTIVTCYTHDYIDYWRLSNIFDYPAAYDYAIEKRRRLIDEVNNTAKKLDYFELFEVIHDVSNRMAAGKIMD